MSLLRRLAPLAGASPRWVLVGGAWSALVFGGVFWLTFPSDAAAKRLAHQVEQKSGGRYRIELTDLKPWWFGLSASNVIVSSRAGAAYEPMLFAESAGLRVGPLGLALKKPTFSAYLALGEGRLDVETTMAWADKRLKSFVVSGDGVPATELLSLVPGGLGGLAISGLLDLDVDLAMPSGLGGADGKLSIVGHDLTLDRATVESLGWNDKELGTKIDEIDLALTFADGKGTVDRGIFASTLVDLEIEGDVDLEDELGRSRVDLQLVADVKDWADTPLASFRSIVDAKLREATWGDEKAHYALDTTLGRLGPSDLHPARERGGRAGRADAGGRVVETPGPLPGTPPPVITPPAPTDGATPEAPGASSAAERAARRAARERDREDDLDVRSEDPADEPSVDEPAAEEDPPADDEEL